MSAASIRLQELNSHTLAGLDIAGSPFLVMVDPAAVVASSTLTGGYGTGVLSAGEFRTVWLQMCDGYGNYAEDYSVADTIQAVATLQSSDISSSVTYRLTLPLQ